MRAFLMAAVMAAAVALAGLHIADAQEAKKPAPSNPVGAAAPGSWTGSVTAQDQSDGQGTLDPAQLAAVKKVSGYFNDIANLKGTFVQTDPDKKSSKGRFYVKRPGRFRFDYGAPSKKVIISDGKLLAIQDFDLNNEDIYELDSTPFRLLMRSDVDLIRDAKIIDAQEADDVVVVTLQDKSPDTPGRMTIYLTKNSTLYLK